MSWDVLVMNYGKYVADEMEEAIGPLGDAEEVRQNVSRYLPGVNWSDPAWGTYDGDGFSIEFNSTASGPVDSMMLHVRGGGDAIAAMLSFSVPNLWTLIDCSSGDCLDPEDPSYEGWEGFQVFRDKALRAPQRSARKAAKKTARGSAVPKKLTPKKAMAKKAMAKKASVNKAASKPAPPGKGLRTAKKSVKKARRPSSR